MERKASAASAPDTVGSPSRQARPRASAATVVWVARNQQSSGPPGPPIARHVLGLGWTNAPRSSRAPSLPPHIQPTQGQRGPNKGWRGHSKCQAALSGKACGFNVTVAGQLS